MSSILGKHPSYGQFWRRKLNSNNVLHEKPSCSIQHSWVESQIAPYSPRGSCSKVVHWIEKSRVPLGLLSSSPQLSTVPYGRNALIHQIVGWKEGSPPFLLTAWEQWDNGGEMSPSGTVGHTVGDWLWPEWTSSKDIPNYVQNGTLFPI